MPPFVLFLVCYNDRKAAFMVAFLFIYKYMPDRYIKAIYTIYRVYTPIDY